MKKCNYSRKNFSFQTLAPFLFLNRCKMYFKNLANEYRFYKNHPEMCYSLMLAFLCFIGSCICYYYAGRYATVQASNSVTDLLLSNIQVYDVSFFFIPGAMLLVVYINCLLLIHPKYIPFVLYAFSLFILIRCMFISITHIAPPVGGCHVHLPLFASRYWYLATEYWLFEGDCFFSGHTGVPFLMSLIFWDNKLQRYIFLLWSIFFGLIVLLGHIHYSIDVFAAFFITYGIYHITKWLFSAECNLLSTCTLKQS